MKKICILGSGAGGGVLALELSKIWPGEICIIDLDSKSKKYKRVTQLKAKFISNVDNKNTRGFGLGGGSNLWHGVITTLDKQDYNAIDNEAGTKLTKNLNLGWSELRRYFPYAVKLLKKKISNDFSKTLIKEGNLIFKKYLVSPFPLRLRKLLIKELSSNHKLNYVDNALALKLNTDNSNNIFSVDCIKKNKTIAVRADIFILSLGAIENPRILLQSFNNKLYQSKSIGKNLIDHPFATIGKIYLPKKIIYRANGYSSILLNSTLRFGYVQSNARVGQNHSILIRPSISNDIRLDRQNIKKLIYGKINFTLILSILRSKTLFKTCLILMSEKFGIGYFTNVFDITMQFEMYRKDNAQIKLSKQIDSFGRLIPQVNYKVPKRFYADIRKMQRQIKESLFNQAVFKNYSISDISFTSGAHYSGTCRLGFNPKSSVVDKNLKYHQINNLYICDSSVLPFIGNSNLFFTISLFSIRLAKHLYKKYISS